MYTVPETGKESAHLEYKPPTPYGEKMVRQSRRLDSFYLYLYLLFCIELFCYNESQNYILKNVRIENQKEVSCLKNVVVGLVEFSLFVGGGGGGGAKRYRVVVATVRFSKKGGGKDVESSSRFV